MTRRLATASAMAMALFAHAAVARADCTDAGACASNQYCATSAGDAGVVVSDGGAGVCLPEPCVVSTDCPNGLLCDTATEPHACIVHPTPKPTPDAAIEDGGGDLTDATFPVFTFDASSDASEPATPESDDAGPDTGSLAGGACDCTLATPRDSTVATFGAWLALGLVAFARRRLRTRAKDRH